MSQENQSEEIDLMQLFGMIKEFFRKFLKLMVDIVLFYKKKALLFFIILIVGAGLGFFMDKYQDTKYNFVQEVVVQPKYNSVEYIYDFVEDLEKNFKDSIYVSKLGLKLELVENVKEVVLEPVIQPKDVLNDLKTTYGDNESFIEGYDQKQLTEKKYRNFYNQHKLTISFENRDPQNLKITNAILEYLKSNEYYNEIIAISLQQTKVSLEQNKQSLQFINDYLDNLTKNPIQDNNKFIFASESETPTISSLLKRKEALINTIAGEERRLKMDREVFQVIEYSDIVAKRKVLVNRRMFTIPLLLIGLVTAFYFLRFISIKTNEFVNNK